MVQVVGSHSPLHQGAHQLPQDLHPVIDPPQQDGLAEQEGAGARQARQGGIGGRCQLTGVVHVDADGRLRVWFERIDEGGIAPARALPIGALPAFDLGFALTVHKSQGSEYAEVAVLLPPDPEHRVLSRELLYTAASRAKRMLTLHADDAVIDACLDRPVRRAGGLHERLAEALAAATPRDAGSVPG